MAKCPPRAEPDKSQIGSRVVKRRVQNRRSHDLPRAHRSFELRPCYGKCMAKHKFRIGDLVELKQSIAVNAPRGPYEVVRLLPESAVCRSIESGAVSTIMNESPTKHS